jgi:protein-S-isoprenylcysteine O-methyltransferase Ste14
MNAKILLRVSRGLAVTALFIAGLFTAAGSWGWVLGWAYVGLLTAGQTVTAVIIRRKDPELLSRRGAAGEGTKGWDRVALGLFALTYLATVVVAALDAGRGWSPLPLTLWGVGAAMYVLGAALVTWAMSVNTHFEKTVRIQHDRDHAVCDRGPYGWVRHPGYVGAAVAFPLATPLLLGSAWALVPAAASVLTLVVRTALEDRTLQAELAGYAEFATRTRYRLVPGLW